MTDRNTQLWRSFLDRNPNFDLFNFDFTHPDAAGQAALDEASEETTDALKALQRLLRVTPSPSAAESLYQAGLHSAHQIAATPEHQFVRSYSQASKQDGGTEAVRQIHRRATYVVERVRLHTMNCLSLNDVLFVASPVISTAPLNFYNGLPSYEELFGNLNYAQCQDCQSIFSPAAYFVDLMQLIDGYLTKPGHKRLSLRARRPDLWNLPLDCDSTNQEVPYLQIVNQVLEAQVKYRLEAAAKAKSGQTTTLDPLARLATSIYPFSLPFNDELERVRRLLGHFNLTLADIYEDCLVGKTDGDVPGSIAREVLEISPEKYAVLTTSNTAAAYLLQAYGLAANSNLSTLSNAGVFGQQTRLDETQRESLLYQNSRRKRALEFDGATQVYIGNPTELQVTGDLTIEFWLNPANFSNRYSPLYKCVGGEFAITLESGSLGANYPPGLLQFFCGNTGSFSGGSGGYLQLSLNPDNLLFTNQWARVAIVRDISNTRTLIAYINGEQTATNTIPADYEIISSTDNVQIGCGYYGTYEGQIADVRIWNRVRSQDEINADMRRRLKGDEEGLAGYWPLDDGVGTTARDLTANKNYGSLQTATTDSSPGSLLPKPPEWPIAESLAWDGNEINPEILGQFFINQSLVSGSYLGLAADKTNRTQTLNVITPTSATSTPLNNDGTFDRLHRFIRLAEALGWSFADSDLALRSIQPAHATEINQQAIESLAAMRQLQSRLGLQVDELCALWSDANTLGIGAQPGDDEAPQDLFDRTFNYPTSFADPTGKAGAPPYHPSYAQNPFYDQPVIAWTPFAASQADQVTGQPNPDLLTRGCMRAALQLKDADLYRLTNHVLSAAPAGTTTLQLDVPMLSEFYRHSRLARALKLPMGQFLALIELLQSADELQGDQVWTIESVAKIVEWADWMRAAKVNVAQLAYLTTGKINPFVTPVYNPNAIQSLIENMFNNAQSVLLNADSFANGSISDAQSGQIFQSLQANGTIDANGVVLQIPPPVSSDSIELGDLSQQQILDLYVAAKLAAAFVRQDKYVVQQLASFFNASVDLTAAALEFTCKSLAQETIHSNQLFLSQAWEDAATWVATCGLNLYLAQTFNLTSQDLIGMAETPVAFNLAAFGSGFELTLQNLRDITAYKKLCASFGVTDQLRAYFKTPSVDALAEITGWTTDQITELEGQSFWPGWTQFNTVEQVAALARTFSAAETLGVDIGFVLGLRKLNALWLGDEDDAPSEQVWDAYKTAAHQMSQVISATYGSDQALQVAANIEAACEEATRDVLAGFLLWELSFAYDDLKTTDDLYDFLLIDVDMSSAVQISPLKAGLNSLQLYAQTTQMNLEAEVSNQIPRDWWSWMSHYRVWQANREIFLYPENYVNPELRHFKTPQFEQLESGLQQGSLTPSLVEGALSDYLEGMSGVANLEIVASYRAKVQKPDAQSGDGSGVDTVFLFGRTRTQPATFYYRTLRITDHNNIEKGFWTAWQQLNQTINAETVTPVYAFNKLFVFWVEQTQKTVTVTNNNQQQNYQVTTADIKYSFQKLNRNWSPPQMLEQGVVINASGTDDSYVPAQNTETPAWKRVRVLMEPGAENIVILYGDLLADITFSPAAPKSVGNPEIDRYNQMWFKSLNYARDIQTSNASQITSVVPAWMLSSTLACERAILNLNPAFENYCAANIYESNPTQLVYNNYSAIPPTHVTPPTCCFPLNNNQVVDVISGNAATALNLTFPQVPDFPLGYDRTVVGVGDQSGFGATIPTMSGDITTEVWLQITDTQSYSGDVLILADEAANSYIITKSGTGTYEIYGGVRSSSQPQLGSVTDEWVCLAITVDTTAKKFSLYVNGEYSGYTDITEVLSVISMNLGAYPVGGGTEDGFTGNLGQVAVWNSLLSSGEIRFRANNPKLVFPIFGVLPVASLPLLTAEVSRYFGRVEPMGNQSGWFVFDNGDEAFLVAPHGNPFKSTEDIVSIAIAPSSGKDLPVMTVTYSNAASDPGSFDFGDLKLQFIRLTTHTVPTLERELLSGGTDALLSLKSQFVPELKFSRFKPSPNVVAPVSYLLSFDGAYGEYFWELFFYAPFLIANTFSANQRFQLAQKWYQYIFNPTQTANTDGLVSYWPLNGNAADAVGANDGTPSNKSPNFVEIGFADGSMRTVFNSSGTNSNSVWLDNPADLNLTEAITLEGWCRLTSLGGDQSWIIEKEIDRSSGESWESPWFVYRLCTIDGTFTFSLSINGEYEYVKTSTTTPFTTANLNEWYYVVGTYDGKNLCLYVNGELIGTSSAPGSIATSSSNVALGGDSFYGQLSGLGIWNRALSQDEVAERYAIKTPQDRFWRFRPFLEIGADTIKDDLTNPQQIKVYEYDPFDPDAVARLRAGAYPKGIVMRYIANLLRWGNRLFAQYTWETLSEATMLYTESLDLLGPQPKQVGALPAPPTRTVEDFVKEYGTTAHIPDFLVQLENNLSYKPGGAQQTRALPFNLLNSYFCVPVNRGLLALWREADNQLYKIRHGENIKGQPQQLSLYGAPLNPAALAKAGASGAASPAGQSAGAPTIPYYRFSYLIQQAKETAGQVSQLGSQLLGALEKQDAEQLAAMLNNNEATILNLTTRIKQNQIKQLQQAAQSLQAGLASAQLRQQTYGAWLQGQSGPGGSATSSSSQSSDSADGDWTQSLSSSEQTSLGLTYGAAIAHTEAALIRTLSSVLYLLPDIFGLADGGMNFGGSMEAIAGTFDSIGGALGATSQLTTAVAQFQRRDQEWMLQYQLAGDDVEQIQAQLAANQTETASAEQDLQINQEQITQNQAVGSFYQTKFTNQQLYQWMAGRLSTLYFQGYQLAFELAQEAQAAFQYENNSGKNFLDYGAWDSLEKGLTAADSLALSLSQLEKANIDAGLRHLEIEKTISLSQLDPQALIDLKQTGQCSFNLTEQLFDYDYPGHYNRKIATVSLTIPAIVGPYQNLHATLTQTANRVVTQPELNAVEYLLPGSGTGSAPASIRSNWNVNQQIAISRGVNDSGLFVLNFEDPRYLPFEGTGAISSWTLEMPKAANAIDFNSISDVIIGLSYTSQDGGSNFKSSVAGLPAIASFDGVRMLSLRQNFPEAWHLFKNGKATTPALQFEILRAMFPVNLKPGSVALGDSTTGAISVQWLVAEADTTGLPTLSLNGQTVVNGSVALAVPSSAPTNLPVNLSDFGPSVKNSLIAGGKIPEQVEDVILIIPFTGDSMWNCHQR